MTAIEIGSGVGGNVWALTQWGFFVYGLELSHEAIKLGIAHSQRHGYEFDKEYRQYKAPAPIHLPARSTQAIVDIQTLQHLNEDEHKEMYKEIYRLLAPGGRFFSVHWVGGDAALDIFPAHKELCAWTRFHVFSICSWLEAEGFKLPQAQCHITGRTYQGANAPAEWAVIEAVKP